MLKQRQGTSLVTNVVQEEVHETRLQFASDQERGPLNREA